MHQDKSENNMEDGVRPSSYKRSRQALVQEEPAGMEEDDECVFAYFTKHQN